MLLISIVLFFSRLETSLQSSNIVLNEDTTVSFHSISRKSNELVFDKLYSYTQFLEGSSPERLYLLFHGFGGCANTTSNIYLANALLNRGETDILAVDYKEAVAVPYPKAVNASLSVGKMVAEFLSTSTSSLKFVGTSLGAHVAGTTAKVLKEKYFIEVDLIIGLDPAMPIFSGLELAHRLDPGDAKFVVVVHTSAGELGLSQPVGHVDFYPNGGINPQPQCVTKRRQWVDSLLEVVCSHRAAVYYISESVNGGFEATKCSSWEDYTVGLCKSWPTVEMGFDLPPSTRGLFFLRTNHKPPFGKPKDCSPIAKDGELLAMSHSTSEKEANEGSLITGLLIFFSQFASIWIIWHYYPYE